MSLGAAGFQLLSRVVLPSGEIWTEDYREGGDYVMDWRMAARFRFSRDGRGLSCRPHPGSEPVSVRVAGHLSRAVAESLGGKESLHATALSEPRGGRALALLGPSGEGKSSMAAKLIRRGWRLLGDDALPFEVLRGRAWAWSRASHLKLAPDAERRLAASGGLHGLEKEFDPNLDKWIFRFPKSGSRAPLSAACLLARREGGRGEPRLARLRGARAALVLKACFYNRLILTPGVLRRQFDLACRLAEAVPVWKLSYPGGLGRLDRVCDAVERSLDAP